ncbi:hypothetical protein [Micromonospora sp. WMMD1219]|uniref:hypothetical protein n=1 Tax=Micromonospora sp. WMMD1219 TaxID=3404115 RepID=UPI003BF4C1C0
MVDVVGADVGEPAGIVCAAHRVIVPVLEGESVFRGGWLDVADGLGGGAYAVVAGDGQLGDVDGDGLAGMDSTEGHFLPVV